jgi:FkbM family methyltransferase
MGLRLPSDPAAAFIDRIVGTVNPAWRADIHWRNRRRRGDIGYRVVRAFVGSGDTVADVGANWGFYSYLLRRLVGSGGHVHSFEPNPVLEPALRRLDRARNVTVHRVGLSDSSAHAGLRVPVIDGREVSAMATLSGPRGASAPRQTIPVTLCRLDDVFDPPPPSLAFLKCDVEGHEAAVFRGAQETLERFHPTILVEVEQRHQDSDITQVFEQLEGHSYRGYMIGGDSVRPLDEFDVRRHQLDLLEDPDVEQVPNGYVNEFVFVLHESDSSINRLVGNATDARS